MKYVTIEPTDLVSGKKKYQIYFRPTRYRIAEVKNSGKVILQNLETGERFTLSLRELDGNQEMIGGFCPTDAFKIGLSVGLQMYKSKREKIKPRYAFIRQQQLFFAIVEDLKEGYRFIMPIKDILNDAELLEGFSPRHAAKLGMLAHSAQKAPDFTQEDFESLLSEKI